MYSIHGFVDDEMYFKRSIPHLPRTGETLRLNDETYVKVTEVIWCLDESSAHVSRINLRTERLPE